MNLEIIIKPLSVCKIFLCVDVTSPVVGVWTRCGDRNGSVKRTGLGLMAAVTKSELILKEDCW